VTSFLELLAWGSASICSHRASGWNLKMLFANLKLSWESIWHETSPTVSSKKN
jgi:hypothetical protein